MRIHDIAFFYVIAFHFLIVFTSRFCYQCDFFLILWGKINYGYFLVWWPGMIKKYFSASMKLIGLWIHCRNDRAKKRERKRETFKSKNIIENIVFACVQTIIHLTGCISKKYSIEIIYHKDIWSFIKCYLAIAIECNK